MSEVTKRRQPEGSQPEPGTYTLPQAAHRLGIGVATIYDLNRRGEVPVPVLRIGKQHRIRKADLEAYLAAHISRVDGSPEEDERRLRQSPRGHESRHC